MPTYRTILTARGLELEAEAAANSTVIVLTDMAIGDGNGNPVTPSEAQTALVRQVYRAGLNQLQVDPTDPQQFIAELVIPAVTGGFVMREVGLYTADNELFAVANLPDTYKPTALDGAFSDTVIRMVFRVTNASVVNLVIDPNVTIATRTWVLNSVSVAGLIPGGLTNQVLAKVSNADGDVEWRDPTAAAEVVVYSREETQTLAFGQTIIDLATITAEGVAVYIEGVRLKEEDFVQTGPAQISLADGYPAGTEVTIVQNEEVGLTEMLLAPNNLSDVPNKAVARTNLGIPTAIATASIDWSQLVNVPATFTPSAHTHVAADVTDFSEAVDDRVAALLIAGSGITLSYNDALNRLTITSTATGGATDHGALTGLGDDDHPQYHNDTRGDARYYTKTLADARYALAAHTHTIANVTGLQTALDGKYDKTGGPISGNVTVTGSVTASAGFQNSTRRSKTNIVEVSEHSALDALLTVRAVEYDRKSDGGHAFGVIAEDLVDGPFDFAVARDVDGQPIAVDYSALFMAALRVTQSLAQRVANLEAMIGAGR